MRFPFACKATCISRKKPGGSAEQLTKASFGNVGVRGHSLVGKACFLGLPAGPHAFPRNPKRLSRLTHQGLFWKCWCKGSHSGGPGLVFLVVCRGHPYFKEFSKVGQTIATRQVLQMLGWGFKALRARLFFLPLLAGAPFCSSGPKPKLS